MKRCDSLIRLENILSSVIDNRLINDYFMKVNELVNGQSQENILELLLLSDMDTEYDIHRA